MHGMWRSFFSFIKTVIHVGRRNRLKCTTVFEVRINENDTGWLPSSLLHFAIFCRCSAGSHSCAARAAGTAHQLMVAEIVSDLDSQLCPASSRLDLACQYLPSEQGSSVDPVQNHAVQAFGLIQLLYTASVDHLRPGYPYSVRHQGE
jgi:hypothetical protein